MRDVFGVQPQVLIDELIAHQQRPPAERQGEDFRRELAARDARLAAMEKEMQDSAQREEQSRASEQLRQYKEQHISPVLADRAKFELTHRALGEKAADEVYSLQKARYDAVQAGKAGKTVGNMTAAQAAALPLLSPAQAAEMIEAELRRRRDVLTGASAPPGKPPEPAKTDGPPRAEASGPPAQKPPAPSSAAWRNPPKPYTRKMIR